MSRCVRSTKRCKRGKCLLLVIVYLIFIVVSVGAISAQNQLESRQEDDGCGLVSDSTSTRWREYREPDYRDLELLKPCVEKWQSHLTLAPPVSSKLDCKTDVDLRQFQETMKSYGVVWFIGDSLLQEMFALTACMLDPHHSNHGSLFNLRTPGKHFLEVEWKHDINNNATTFLRFSNFGRKWGLIDNLYKHAYMKAVDTLGDKDAIILNAAYHYDSPHLHLFEKDLTFFAKQSMRATASVFFIQRNTYLPLLMSIYMHFVLL
jgi:hypothetical protein